MSTHNNPTKAWIAQQIDAAQTQVEQHERQHLENGDRIAEIKQAITELQAELSVREGNFKRDADKLLIYKGNLAAMEFIMAKAPDVGPESTPESIDKPED